MNRKTVCIDLDGTLVHYEEWQGEEHFGKVLPGASTATKALCWTIFFEANKSNALSILRSYYSVGIFVLLVLSAAFTLISILGICKNRTYFVKVSRYINEHRKFALDNSELSFHNVSKMWNNPKMPKNLDWCSTQLICLYLLCGCYILEIILAGVVYDMPFTFLKVVCVVLLIVISISICGFSIWKSLKE